MSQPLSDVDLHFFAVLAFVHVDDQGFIAGTKNSTPDRRGNVIQTAMLWKQSVGYIPLKPPKGGSDSASRSMAVAPGGATIYVVGVTNASGSWTAARWVVK